MIQAQYYNFVRLGRSGYTAIVDNMLANARYLNEQLEATGRFEILNPGLAEPVVTFRLKERSGLRRVPPVGPAAGERLDRARLHPAAQRRAVNLLRVVVRNDLSRAKIDMLLLDLAKAWDELDKEKPVDRHAPKPDVWTAPEASAAHAKARTGFGH